jgi:tripartite ATP-independent transporter DctM subunit
MKNKIKGIINLLHRVENISVFIAVLLLALIPFLEVIARKFFQTSISYSTDYTHHLVIFVTFLGAMITSREKKHLSLSLTLKINEPLKSRIYTVNMLFSSMMTTAFFWSALSFVFNGFDPSKKIGVFPIRMIGMIMVIGYAVMAIRFITAIEKKGLYRLIASSGIIFGSFLALDSISNLLSLLFNELPSSIEAILGFCHTIIGIIAVPLILTFIVLAVLGTPLFVVLGGIAYLLFARVSGPLEVIPNEAYSMLISHSIPAIPLFTVTGFILSESKAGERLVRFFKAFFSWFPGGLAVMTILVCAFFTTFTGASGVTILALGGLLSFVLINSNYKRKFTLGLITASGSIGLLFPPSLPIIIYGVIAGVSIKDMFIGGLLPGVVMVLALVIFCIIFTSKNKIKRESFEIKEAFSALKSSMWEILLPVVIVSAYFGGLTTIVESAAIALVYSFVIEVFIHRDIEFKRLPEIFLKAVVIIGGILIILSVAKGLSYFIIDAQIPMKLSAWVQANISSKYVFLLLLNLALLTTGCLMDIFSAIMVVVPLIIPLGSIFGIHPVHLGIIFLANMELGYMTPPVGLNLFLASYRFNEPMGKLYKDVLPFFFIQIIAVLLITYIPFLSTGLLNLF